MSTETHSCLIAQSASDRDQVYRLRYTCYRRTEATATRPDEKFSDQFDDEPNSFTFLIRDHLDEATATPLYPKGLWTYRRKSRQSLGPFV